MKNPKKSMELEHLEITALEEIQDSRVALLELQQAIIPFAEAIAKRQRVWWDRVIKAHGLTKEVSYAIENGRVIVNKADKKLRE